MSNENLVRVKIDKYDFSKIHKIVISYTNENKTFKDWINNLEKALKQLEDLYDFSFFIELEILVKENEFDFYQINQFLKMFEKYYKNVKFNKLEIVLNGIDYIHLFSSKEDNDFLKFISIAISFDKDRNKILFDLSQNYLENLKISTFQINGSFKKIAIDFTNKINLDKCKFSFIIEPQLLIHESVINLDNFLYFLTHSSKIVDLDDLKPGTISIVNDITIFDCEIFKKIYPIFQNIDFKNSNGCEKIIIKNFSKQDGKVTLDLNVFKNVKEVVFDGYSGNLKNLFIEKSDKKSKLKKVVFKNFNIDELIFTNSLVSLKEIKIENSKFSELDFDNFNYKDTLYNISVNIKNVEVEHFVLTYFILEHLKIKNFKVKNNILLKFVDTDLPIDFDTSSFKINYEELKKHKSLMSKWIVFLIKLEINGEKGFINYLKNLFSQDNIDIDFEIFDDNMLDIFEVYSIVKKHKFKNEKEIDNFLNFFEMKKMILS